MNKQNPKSTNFAVLRSMTINALLIVLGLALLGCKALPKPVGNIYQPRILVLPAGQPVVTANGIYTPTTTEIWHSQQALSEAEKQALDAAAALAQERARH